MDIEHCMTFLFLFIPFLEKKNNMILKMTCKFKGIKRQFNGKVTLSFEEKISILFSNCCKEKKFFNFTLKSFFSVYIFDETLHKIYCRRSILRARADSCNMFVNGNSISLMGCWS